MSVLFKKRKKRSRSERKAHGCMGHLISHPGIDAAAVNANSGDAEDPSPVNGDAGDAQGADSAVRTVPSVGTRA